MNVLQRDVAHAGDGNGPAVNEAVANLLHDNELNEFQ